MPAYEWDTEYRVERTPVDVVGERPAHLVLVELEWRRADPVANPAKVFRHGVDGALDGYDRLTLYLSRFYDLEGGGVSSKREDAEFVGRVADREFDRLTYRPLTLEVDPPKRGGEWPDGWGPAVAATADTVAEDLA